MYNDIRPEAFASKPTEYEGLIKGQWYTVTTAHAVVRFWTENRLGRHLLRQVALDFIGPTYGDADIVSVRGERED